MAAEAEAASHDATSRPAAATGAVAVFAPGGYDVDPVRLQRAERYFASWGRRTTRALAADGRHERFSGTDDERLHRLSSIVGDPAVGIAIALRGGYGATRLLPRIDFDAMARAVRRDGKRFVGHSDFTAIVLGLLARTGAVAFAGPMASYDFGGTDVDPFTEAHFWRAMEEHRVDVEFATDEPRSLRVAGTLWGGNLTMLCSLVGTPWMPDIDGGVLFVEDVNEQPYRIERMLLQLQQAGILDRQRLVLCGDFSGFRVADYDNGYGIDAALARVREATRVPIVAGLPFGHCPKKLTLAVGAAVDVEIDGGRCRLAQRWDLSA